MRRSFMKSIFVPLTALSLAALWALKPLNQVVKAKPHPRQRPRVGPRPCTISPAFG